MDGVKREQAALVEQVRELKDLLDAHLAKEDEGGDGGDDALARLTETVEGVRREAAAASEGAKREHAAVLEQLRERTAALATRDALDAATASLDAELTGMQADLSLARRERDAFRAELEKLAKRGPDDASSSPALRLLEDQNRALRDQVAGLSSKVTELVDFRATMLAEFASLKASVVAAAPPLVQRTPDELELQQWLEPRQLGHVFGELVAGGIKSVAHLKRAYSSAEPSDIEFLREDFASLLSDADLECLWSALNS